MLVINPDAHATGGLRDEFFGVGQARRAGCAAADIFNTRPLEAIVRELQARRSRNPGK
jgi:DNA polymerase (family 10)